MPRTGEFEGLPPDRPFLCPKCGNWYTVLPFDPADVCDRGQHSERAHCHYNHTPATSSERVLGEALLAATRARDSAVSLAAGIGQMEQEQATKVLGAVRENVRLMNVALGKVPEALRMAPIFQLPGREDSVDRGFVTLDGIRVLAQMGRRPDSDVDRSERSERVCRAVAMEVSTVAMETSRLLATLTGEKVAAPPPVAKPDPWAKARAVRQANAAARRAQRQEKATPEGIPAGIPA